MPLELKKRVCESIDSRRDEILALGEDIRIHPELGFKEFRTADLVSKHFQELGIPHQTGLAVTGVKGVLKGKQADVNVAYMGELDSVIVSNHPDADSQTGAAHACGHHAQIANLIALAYGLVESDAMEELDGDISLMAVPAEEFVELKWRLEQKKAGRIEFLGGKPELVRQGAFDEIQMAMMTHQNCRKGPPMLGVAGPNNGALAKLINYRGRAAHAGGSPHRGINALKAAMLGLQDIDANRETFQDSDHVRVHPIVTKGGELVNVVPSDACLETFVRGSNLKAIREAARKVDRSLKSGAMAMGASVEIVTLPSYLPRLMHEDIADLYRKNAKELVGEPNILPSKFGAASSDMGDITNLMPAIQATANGCMGQSHGDNYTVQNPDTAYILPAKAAAMTLVDLLSCGAERAQKAISISQPVHTKESYLKLLRELETRELWEEGDL